jgi:hypothetical protein
VASAGAQDVGQAKAPEAPAGSGYSIDWFTVDAGGGRSTGSGFTADGTFGQPDAGDATAAGFSLRGGFWYSELPEQLFRNGFE